VRFAKDLKIICRLVDRTSILNINGSEAQCNPKEVVNTEFFGIKLDVF